MAPSVGLRRRQVAPVGWNGMKLTHQIHRQKPLSHELWSEWVSERMSAVERANVANQWVVRANGGANGQVLYTSILKSFYPLCGRRVAMRWGEMRWDEIRWRWEDDDRDDYRMITKCQWCEKTTNLRCKRQLRRISKKRNFEGKWISLHSMALNLNSNRRSLSDERYEIAK